ncbi:MAG TPA: hypothetical protein VGL56_14790 [Fimbriimonadaceae bacterium]
MVKEHGLEVFVCVTCLDRLYPDMRLGSLRKEMIRPRKADGKCPNCGWTAEQLNKTGLLGCPLCYEAIDMPPSLLAS